LQQEENNVWLNLLSTLQSFPKIWRTMSHFVRFWHSSWQRFSVRRKNSWTGIGSSSGRTQSWTVDMVSRIASIRHSNVSFEALLSRSSSESTEWMLDKSVEIIQQVTIYQYIYFNAFQTFNFIMYIAIWYFEKGW